MTSNLAFTGFPWLSSFVGESNAKDLMARWREPHRGFHTYKHLRSVLEAFSESEHAFILASFYHDAVYVPGRRDNEAESAKVLLTHTQGNEDRRIVELAHRIVLSTADFEHKTDPDEERFFLADCAVLLRHINHLMRYEKEIRLEFSGIPQSDYIAGRCSFLEKASLVYLLHFSDASAYERSYFDLSSGVHFG